MVLDRDRLAPRLSISFMSCKLGRPLVPAREGGGGAAREEKDRPVNTQALGSKPPVVPKLDCSSPSPHPHQPTLSFSSRQTLR